MSTPPGAGLGAELAASCGWASVKELKLSQIPKGDCGGVEGQVDPSNSCRRARSMLIRCPSLVTPSSM